MAAHQRLWVVTGGIGSGKSSLCHELVELGAEHIDADASAVAALLPDSEVFEQVAATFPQARIRDGMDRAALAREVFTSAERRRQLEAIVHPWVRADMRRRAQASTAKIVVMEVQLLAETRSRAEVRAEFDLSICVWAPLEVRRGRLRAKGLSTEDIDSRLAAQSDDVQRQTVCDIVVPNRGDTAALKRQARALMTIGDAA